MGLMGVSPLLSPLPWGEQGHVPPPQLHPPGGANDGAPRSDHGLAESLLVTRLVWRGLSIRSCCTCWLSERAA